MATNFDDAILSSNGFSPTKVDTPLDKRSRVESVSEVPNIPNPFVGMIFYVSSEDKYYRVKSLKSKVVGGITVQNAQVNEYVPFETGGSGTSSYSDLSDKPSIEGVTLEGNKTLDSLGIASKQSVAEKQDAINKVNVSVGSGTGTPSGSASVSGSTLNISLENIKGQKGDTGATGPANNITIGTVTPSDSTDEASAVIRGEAPDQVLDLVLPRGRQGNSGVTGSPEDLVVVNDLNGGESEVGSIKVLAAEQGKVLNEKISNILYNSVELETEWEDGKFYSNTNGLIGNNANYKLSAVLSVERNDKIEINSGGTGVPFLMKCNELGTAITPLITAGGSAPSDSNTFYSYTFKEPTYVRICYKYKIAGSYVKYYKAGVLARIENLELKLIKLSGIYDNGIEEVVPNIGDIFYNTSSKLLRKRIKSGTTPDCFETVPYEEGAIYTYNDYAYVWNGNELVIINTEHTNLVFYKGKYISNLYIISNNNYSISNTAIKVKKGDKIKITTDCSGGIDLCCKVSNTGTLEKAFVTSVENAELLMKEYDYEFEEDCLVRICYKSITSGSGVEFIKSYNSEFNDIAGSNNNLIWTVGKYYSNNTGFVMDNTNYKLSDVFKLKKGDIVEINSAGSYGLSFMVKCSENGTFISPMISSASDATNEDNKLYQYTVNEDCFARIAYKYKISGSYARIYSTDKLIWKKIKELNDANNSGTKRHLKILLLGNSYSSDAWGYVPFILKNYGITCEIYMYWRGALSLDDLIKYWETSQAHDADSPQASLGTYRYLYHIDTRSDTKWNTMSRMSAKDLVALGGWDIITLLQYSVYTIDYSKYNPYFEQVVSLIRESIKTPFTLGWQMSWTRPSADEPKSNISAAEQNDKDHAIGITFPCATAIFNARTNDTLNKIGDSVNNNLWCSDESHLEEGIPCYIAGLAVVQSLFDKYYSGLNVMNDTTRPTTENIKEWNNPQQQLPVSGEITTVNDENCYLSQKAAILANKRMFVITNI